MSYSPDFSSPAIETKLRNSNHKNHISGMCAVCSSECKNLCDIGYSAIRGTEAIYPSGADQNQYASEKNYPVDFSSFNINGHVFGTMGIEMDCNLSFMDPKTDISIGNKNPIHAAMPIILPAIAKLDWEDYFMGAALAGVPAVVGEAVISKDSEVVYQDGKVTDAPLLKRMIQSYRKHQKEYGEIVVQGNVDDIQLGVLDYVVEKLNVKTIEFKFGQGSKGIQGMGVITSLDKALKLKKEGYLIVPDPEDPVIQEQYIKDIGPHFKKFGRLPMWTRETLFNKVQELRGKGAEHIFFKMGPYGQADLEELIKMACEAEIDLITFDSAGGGTGNSPIRMMNEWGYPAVLLEELICKICNQLPGDHKKRLPSMAIAGGFAMEDQIMKALSFGAPYISMAGVGKAAMAAAMTGRRIGKDFQNGCLPDVLAKYSLSLMELFPELRELRGIYGYEADTFPTGAIGVYSYLKRLQMGLRQFMTLNRKFELNQLNREDLIPLTQEASMLIQGKWFI